MPKRTRKSLTPEESEGALAWKRRYVVLYDEFCDVHQAMRAVTGLIDMGNIGDAKVMADRLIARYDEQVRKLVA